MRRALIVIGIAGLAALGLAPAAGALPDPLSVAGTASPANVTGPGTVTYTYTLTVSGSPATGVVITTAQDALVPADATSIQVDGNPVPTATVTAAAPDFTLRAGTGADATNGGSLTVGAHTLVFTSAVTSTAPAATSSTIAVTTDAGSVTSAPVAVTLNEPDLALAIPADSGEDSPAPLGTGQTIYYDAELRNFGSPSAGTLTIALPAGLKLGSDGVMIYANASDWDEGIGDALPCTGDQGTFTCALDTVATTGGTNDPPIIEIALLATSSGIPGTSGQFTVSVAPTTGTDLNPSDNSLTATIDFTGVADLTFTITPGKAKATVGHTTTLTLRVTNHGPQPAPSAIALALLDSTSKFQITGFDGNPLPTSGLARSRARASLRSLVAAAPKNAAIRRFAQAALGSSGSGSGSGSGSSGGGVGAGSGSGPVTSPTGIGTLWFIGTLAPGTTATAHLTLKAKAVGTARFLFMAASSAADPGCVSDNDPCQPAFATLTAVRAVSTSGSGQRPIANTGFPAGDLSLIGVALLLGGAALTSLGRRRRTRRA